MSYQIKLATIDNAKDIKRIYEHYIINTCYTFEYDVPTKEDFEQRISDTLKLFPYLVYELDGKVVGYAYAGKQAVRAAYGFNATVSVYVDKDYMGQKIGSRLYNELFRILKLQHYVNLYAVITGINHGSIAMHKKMGFETFAIYKNTGYKHEKWMDVVWMDKVINSHDIPPKKVIDFKDLVL